MSTELLTMQSTPVPRYRESELDIKMASEISNLYHPHDGWAISSNETESGGPSPNYMRFTVPRIPTVEGRSEQRLVFGRERGCTEETTPVERRLSRRCADESIRRDYNTSCNTSTPTTPLGYGTSPLYTQPPTFTVANVMAQSTDMATVSPLQTHVEQEAVFAGSNISFERLPRAPGPPPFIEHSSSERQIPRRQPSGSSQNSEDDHPPTQKHPGFGRRRRSEFAVIGSARAIYLEKNRKAASKCRSKQKRQQENLVEEARGVERKNQALKVEVEMLKSGMRELMDIVGQHTHCSDSRLKLYVQREADRLATGCSEASRYA
ncbi:hypothetical protein FB567DRAFT_84178 [Paraphoma chrysanthemicola]|uniref:BZIP domain-containing protein n=1 Tax=Paraphoma chrysanthemicola TaxID=798071 RepID=A0A8K0R301_9PLEO|nr:hypothetical protein FB567DRAFT_84178 [Paraphoma chrysanthemicola]